MTFGMLAFILKDKGWIKEQATEGLTKLIKHYREDPDQQNLIGILLKRNNTFLLHLFNLYHSKIDWLQGSAFFCCGIAGKCLFKKFIKIIVLLISFMYRTF